MKNLNVIYTISTEGWIFSCVICDERTSFCIIINNYIGIFGWLQWQICNLRAWYRQWCEDSGALRVLRQYWQLRAHCYAPWPPMIAFDEWIEPRNRRTWGEKSEAPPPGSIKMQMAAAPIGVQLSPHNEFSTPQHLLQPPGPPHRWDFLVVHTPV